MAKIIGKNSERQIQRWEDGTEPGATWLPLIAKATSKPMDWFFVDHDAEEVDEDSVEKALAQLARGRRLVETAELALNRLLTNTNPDLSPADIPDGIEHMRARRKRSAPQKSSDIPRKSNEGI